MNRFDSTHPLRPNAGFSLVELMVAMVISLIVLAAVSSVMVTTKKTNTAQTAQARMQDNARIALQIIAYDIRQSGYFGCSTGNGSNSFSNDLNTTGTPHDPSLNVTIGIDGANAGDTAMSPSSLGEAVPTGADSNSDVIALRYADGANGITVQTPYMTQASSELHVSTNSGLSANDIVMVTDCNGGDLFQITNINSSGSQSSLVHNGGNGAPGNSSGKLSRTYSGDAHIARFIANTYFIKDNAQGQPSLYRKSLSTGAGDTQELVEGIEQMRILYGVDGSSPSDGKVDCYIPAGAKCGAADLSTAAGWSKVYSVRIGLLARTLANNTVNGDKSSASGNTAELDSNTYDFFGDGMYTVNASTLSTADRRYQRHIFRTTVMVHNHPGT